MQAHRRRSLALIVSAILLATIFVLAGSDGSIVIGDAPVFALCVLLAFIIQWALFIPAYIFQTERFYDLTGSFTYLSMLAVALAALDSVNFRSGLIAALITIWAMRLGGFLFLRILKDGSDHRFDAIKPDWLRFLSAWTLQGLWVSITLSAGLAAITSSRQPDIGVMGALGATLWLLGFIIEVAADYQKRVFKTQLRGQPGFITTGLWAYSRHPNYFGEILLWVGIAFIALPALSGWQYLTLCAPLFVYVLLSHVSGVPLLEQAADKRWGENVEYQRYKARTPVLIPRIY